MTITDGNLGLLAFLIPQTAALARKATLRTGLFQKLVSAYYNAEKFKVQYAYELWGARDTKDKKYPMMLQNYLNKLKEFKVVESVGNAYCVINRERVGLFQKWLLATDEERHNAIFGDFKCEPTTNSITTSNDDN
jgi:hypothetical protein